MTFAAGVPTFASSNSVTVSHRRVLQQRLVLCIGVAFLATVLVWLVSDMLWLTTHATGPHLVASMIASAAHGHASLGVVVDVSATAPHAVPLRALDAYVTVATGDLERFPNYVYGALALMASIRRFDASRHRIVLADELALELYPRARVFFERNGIIVVPIAPRHAGDVLARNASDKWRGAFSKLAIFDLDLLGYRTIVYLDADSIALNDPRPLFDLPFARGIAAYGMRDVYHCRTPNTTPQFMSALLVWRSSGGANAAHVRLSARIANTVVDSMTRGIAYPGDQQLIAEALGSELVLLDETWATVVFRCTCRREGNGVRSLSDSRIVHFTGGYLDMHEAALSVLANDDLIRSIDPADPEQEYEPRCEYVAFSQFMRSLRDAFSMYRSRADKILQRVPCTTQPLCSAPPFVTTSIQSANLQRLIDGNWSTFVMLGARPRAGDHVSVNMPPLAPLMHAVQIVQPPDSPVQLVNGVHYAVFADDYRVPANGFVFRSFARLRLQFLVAVPHLGVPIAELAMEPMPSITFELLLRSDARTACAAATRDGGGELAPSATPDATWDGAPADMMPSPQEHSLLAAMDSNAETAAWIAWPRACSALRFTFGRPLLAGGVRLLFGERSERRDILAFGDVWLNGGSVLLASNATGESMDLEFASDINVSDIRIDLQRAYGRWLRVREVSLLPPKTATQQQR